ncbi:MAG: glycosyl transferase family 1, partial [Muribaculaceae bacterium]|nr:glycosyl transferase family 1 [Muribaculaceae bacterium]
MAKRVLIVNKFYYPRGGDCICAINLETMLKAAGYETAVYSMSFPENIACEDSKYFASEVSFGGGIANKLKALKRVLGLGDIKKSFAGILEDFKPDVVHFHNIHSYLSPIVVKMAHDAGAKTVWTMHDYKLVCPAYSCRRGTDSKTCEECFADANSNPKGVISNRCMKGSLVASGIAYIEAKRWKHDKLISYTDAFV